MDRLQKVQILVGGVCLGAFLVGLVFGAPFPVLFAWGVGGMTQTVIGLAHRQP